MSVSVGIDDRELRAAIKKLDGLTKQLGNRRARKRVLRKAAKPLVAAAKANVKDSKGGHKRYNTKKATSKLRAPKGLGNVVEEYSPGTLRESIGIKNLRKSPDIFVGIKGKRKNPGFAYYAHWVEFGATNVDGTKRKASPYMRPAVDSTQQRVADIIVEQTKVEIERYAKKNAV